MITYKIRDTIVAQYFSAEKEFQFGAEAYECDMDAHALSHLSVFVKACEWHMRGYTEHLPKDVQLW